MIDKFTTLKTYITYLIQSKTKHGTHSPFVYKLLEDCIYDKTYFEAYKQIDNLRNKLLKSNEYITINDLGAGSKTKNNNRRKISAIVKHSSVSKKYGQLLFRLTRYFKPNNILELGTNLGLGTTYLSKGIPESQITTIEGCENITNKAQNNFSNLGVSNVNLITGNFDQVLKQVVKSIPSLDMIFFDGNHQYESTLNYFEICLDKVNNDSVFVFDDIHWSKQMEKVWKEIINHPRVTVSIDLFRMGLVFFRKEQTKEHFTIRY